MEVTGGGFRRSAGPTNEPRFSESSSTPKGRGHQPMWRSRLEFDPTTSSNSCTKWLRRTRLSNFVAAQGTSIQIAPTSPPIRPISFDNPITRADEGAHEQQI